MNTINFLQVHPATELWWQQRELCQRCVHFRKQGSAMRCAADKHSRSMPWARNTEEFTLRYCIDARLPHRPCGPHGRLFVNKDADK